MEDVPCLARGTTYPYIFLVSPLGYMSHPLWRHSHRPWSRYICTGISEACITQLGVCHGKCHICTLWKLSQFSVPLEFYPHYDVQHKHHHRLHVLSVVVCWCSIEGAVTRAVSPKTWLWRVSRWDQIATEANFGLYPIYRGLDGHKVMWSRVWGYLIGQLATCDQGCMVMWRSYNLKTINGLTIL